MFILIIVIIISTLVGIAMYWVWHQEQYAQTVVNSLTKTPTPTTPVTYSIFLERSIAHNGQTEFDLLFWCNTNSPTDITFSSADISYSGVLDNTYGNFAPQLFNLTGTSPISTYTIRAGYEGIFMIVFPEGVGSPWVSGETVTIVIHANGIQGSITVTLP